MTAFLTAWLSELPCRVMNRPTALCLAGPAWRREQWVRAAAAAGLDILPVVRSTPGTVLGESAECANRFPQGATVTVVAGRCAGVPANVAAGLQRLATAAAAELFRAHLTSLGSDARFVSADLWPDLGRDDVAGAVKAELMVPVKTVR
jgi:hypothetical protein